MKKVVEVLGSFEQVYLKIVVKFGELYFSGNNHRIVMI